MKNYLNKIVNKKLNDRDLFVFQKNLKKDTTVKITNRLNNKSVIATVKSKSNYPNFYNSVITSRIANEIELNLKEPFILIESVDQNSVFYLMSRGLSKEQANKMLVEGFLNEAIETITESNIKSLISKSFIDNINKTKFEINEY